jgi:hypothetical protein
MQDITLNMLDNIECIPDPRECNGKAVPITAELTDVAGFDHDVHLRQFHQGNRSLWSGL